MQLTNQLQNVHPGFFFLDIATADTLPAFFPTERCEGVDLESVALMKVTFSELKSVTEP